MNEFKNHGLHSTNKKKKRRKRRRTKEEEEGEEEDAKCFIIVTSLQRTKKHSRIFLQNNTKNIQYRNAKSHENNGLRGPHSLVNRTTNGIYILCYVNTK